MSKNTSWVDASLQPAGRFLLTLLQAGLTGSAAPAKPEDVSWEDVLRLARFNSLEVIAYYGALLCESPLPDLLRSIWKRDVLRNVTRQVQTDSVREHLASHMEQYGIDYIFMKGIITAPLYPEEGMRQMSDNDILYRYDFEEERGLNGKSQKRMKEMMGDLQAQTISTDGIVDVFLLGEISLFEMHRDFLGPEQKLYGYFHSIWQRAKANNPHHPHQYSLSYEDHYILMLAHSYKHFSQGGCGPREICDVWQFRNRLNDQLDWTYIRAELRKTGLAEYEALLVRLSEILFEQEKGSEEDWALLDWFVSCGTYGSRQNAINNTLSALEEKGYGKRKARWAYVWSRLFPAPEYLQTHFPFFYRHRWLSGFLLVYRAGRGLFYKRKEIAAEMSDLKNAKGRQE